jgi:hypothetical protein
MAIVNEQAFQGNTTAPTQPLPATAMVTRQNYRLWLAAADRLEAEQQAVYVTIAWTAHLAYFAAVLLIVVGILLSGVV